jgi:hypothetical protein
MQKVETPTSEQEQPPNSAKKRRGLVRNHLVPTLIYLLGAIIFTWPLVLNLGDRIINPRTNSADVWQHLWNSWWMRFSLLDLHVQPFYSPVIFWPQGANLFFHALDPLDGYISVPLQLLFGLIAGFNLIFLIQLTLAGYAAYLLARYLTGNYAAALVAGIIYAFSPLESALLNLGQVELTSICWLPFFMLFFIMTLEGEGRPWLNRAGSVFFLLALALVSWYYVLYALLFSGLYFLYHLWKERDQWRQKWPRSLIVYVGILATWAVLVVPILLPTLRDANNGKTRQDLWVVAYNSADLLGFVQPGPSAIWGLFGAGPSSEYRGNFLGIFVMALALVGVVARWRKSWFWPAMGLIFGLLALGPVLHLRFDADCGPKTCAEGTWLPGQLLYYLPFGNIARVPLRFGLMLMLGLAICAAFGLDWLTKNFRLIKNPTLSKTALPLLAGSLIFLEFLPLPRILVGTQIPSFYQQIRNEGKWNDFAVFELPDSVTTLAMYYQTAHQHPILNAYLSRRPEYNFEQTPGIRELRFLNPDKEQAKQEIQPSDILDRNTLQNIPAVLNYYKIRYVILHPKFVANQAEAERAQEIIRTAFGNAPPYYQDADLQVWRVPELNQSKPDVTRVLTAFGNGWGELENGSDKQPRRSTGSKAELLLVNPFQTELTVQLVTNVQSNKNVRSLQIQLEGQKLAEQQIPPEGSKLNLQLKLKPGLNRLSFSSENEPGNKISFWFESFKLT